MKHTSLLIAALFVAGAALAQQTPTAPAQSSPARTDVVKPTVVKGHVLGESFEDFVRKAGLREKLAACAAEFERPDQKYKYESGIRKYQCEQLAKEVRAEGTGLGIHTDLGFHPGDATFEFSGGKLARVWLIIYDSYHGVRADLIERYGPPTDEESVVLQNAFGTKWTVMSGTWKMADGAEISASESSKFGDLGIYVTFRSKDEVARTSADRKKPTNPFD